MVKPKSPLLITALPPELLLHVFNYLNPVTLLKISSVCRTWFQLTRDAHLWKVLPYSPFFFTLYSSLNFFFCIHQNQRLCEETWRTKDIVFDPGDDGGLWRKVFFYERIGQKSTILGKGNSLSLCQTPPRPPSFNVQYHRILTFPVHCM